MANTKDLLRAILNSNRDTNHNPVLKLSMCAWCFWSALDTINLTFQPGLPVSSNHRRVPVEETVAWPA